MHPGHSDPPQSTSVSSAERRSSWQRGGGEVEGVGEAVGEAEAVGDGAREPDAGGSDAEAVGEGLALADGDGDVHQSIPPADVPSGQPMLGTECVTSQYPLVDPSLQSVVTVIRNPDAVVRAGMLIPSRSNPVPS